MPSLLLLPRDILISVFTQWVDLRSLADADEAVCNQRQRVSFESLLSCETFVVEDTVDYPACRWMAHRSIKGVRFSLLDLECFYRDEVMPWTIIRKVLELSPIIKELSISCHPTTHEIFEYFGHKIESFKLDSDTKWSSSDILKMLPHLSPEKFIGFETGKCCCLIDSEFCELLANQFPNLKLFKPIGVQNMECDFSVVILNCSNLRDLHLPLVRHHNNILSLIGEHSHLLGSLRVELIYNLSSGMLCGLAKGCKLLRQLHLSVHSATPGDDLSVGFSAIAKQCQLLRDLTLHGDAITDTVLIALSKQCVCFKSLLIASKSVTDKGMAPLIEKTGATVETLVVMNKEFISDITLVTIAKHCSELRCFRCNSDTFTEYCVMLLYDKCRKLAELSVAICSVSTLLHITRGCRELSLSGGRSMYIFEINRVGGEVTVYTDMIESYTTDCLRTIALLNPQLESLNLNYQTVNSGDMAYMKSVCPKLKHFNIDKCDGYAWETFYDKPQAGRLQFEVVDGERFVWQRVGVFEEK